MVISKTPFRISLFGGGTDYPVWYKKHGGSVISTSINKYCYITTRFLPPFFHYKFRIRYTHRETTASVSQIRHPSVRACLRFMGVKNGIEMVHTSDLPAMSGLGSSSAFTVGFLHSLYSLFKKNISKKRLALDAINVEQHLIRESVGSQDQVIASFGGFNKIDFYPSGKILVHPLKINQNRLLELENHLMLFFTGFQRKASNVAAQIIKNANKKAADLHEINWLTNNALKVLTNPKKNITEIGQLLHHHWGLKKGLASNITTSYIDQTYDSALKNGALGGKILGAGGGGFILFFVTAEKQNAVKKALKDLLHVPFKFEAEGSKIIYRSNNL